MWNAAYRAAGRPEANFVMERLMDRGARQLGLDPADIRRRNFVPRDAFPYRNATGFVYDSGDYLAAFEKALAIADYKALRAEQQRARERGGITGIGLASYVENAALGWESGSVRVERTGAVTVVTGSSPHGQGHETTWAQVVADALGVGPEVIAVRHGDTQGAPQGFGTFGSRSTALAGGALVRAAAEVRAKGRRIAAILLEAASPDVVDVDGGFQVAGVGASAPASSRSTWTATPGAWASRGACGWTTRARSSTRCSPRGSCTAATPRARRRPCWRQSCTETMGSCSPPR
jgi:carbon-monoxide dehydrogenase large subunit